MDSSFELQNSFGGSNQLYSNIVNYPSEDVNNEVFSNVVNYPREDVYNEVFSGADSMVSNQLNFEIFSGQDGEETSSNNVKFDAQKFADTITAVGSATGSVVGTVQAFQDPSKKAQRKTARAEKKEVKKTLKEVCGKRPLLKKNRTEYDKCVSNYNTSIRSIETKQTQQNDNQKNKDVNENTVKGDNKKMLMYIGIGALVLIAGYVIYKKKFAKS